MPLPQDIIDFYLTRSPHAKSDKADSRLSIDLSTYGWEKANLDSLMKWILTHHLTEDGVGNLSFSIANQLDEPTVSKFRETGNQDENASLGGVLCIKKNINADEGNQIKCVLSETYVTCFFRHIRNSIAHGNYVYDDNTKLVCLYDQASNVGTKDPRFNAVLLTSTQFLEELIPIVLGGPEAIPDKQELNSRLSGATYRITRIVQAQVNESGE